MQKIFELGSNKLKHGAANQTRRTQCEWKERKSLVTPKNKKAKLKPAKSVDKMTNFPNYFNVTFSLKLQKRFNSDIDFSRAEKKQAKTPN